MKIKVSESTGRTLDLLVAKALGKPYQAEVEFDGVGGEYAPHRFSTDWEQGGPIIEREKIAIRNWLECGWQADKWNFNFVDGHAQGPTPLIAAMRCYVASKLGDEVEIPKELT